MHVAVAAVLCTLLITWMPAAAGAAQSEIRLEGSVTVSGAPVPTNSRLSVRTEAGSDEGATECGTTRTTDGGKYVLSLTAECTPGTTVVFVLDAIGEQADQEYELTSGVQTLDIEFSSVSPEDLATLGVAAASDQGEASAVADAVAGVAEAVTASSEASTSKPLIKDWQLFAILLIIIVGTGGLLLMLARRQVAAGADEASQREHSQYTRRLIEGLVLTEVLVAVVILGVTAKVSPEGVISVLAAITGYAIGKSSQ